MAGAHQHRAEHDGAAAPEEAIGNQTAEHRREIDKAGVEPEDLRRQRQRAHAPEYALEPGAEGREAGDVLDMTRGKQCLAHVEYKQSGHAVIGEALPGLGEGEKGETYGLAKKSPRRPPWHAVDGIRGHAVPLLSINLVRPATARQGRGKRKRRKWAL
jgi:hypothetical protein